MRIAWTFDEQDTRAVATLVAAQRTSRFVRSRLERNVDGPAPAIDRDTIWTALCDCLLTTQQKSGPGSAVNRFLVSDPFPLVLGQVAELPAPQSYVEKALTDFGGLRRAPTIASQLADNLRWLKDGGWDQLQPWTDKLAAQRGRTSQWTDFTVERDAAHFIDETLVGFGPKQSRNFWQILGLSRFEIPVDSRLTKWLNRVGFPLSLSAGALADLSVFEFVEDGIRALCQASDVLPCVFDASVFSSFDTEWTDEALGR